MDEYDEMYGIEDDFERQFADELEVMAEMERKWLYYYRKQGERGIKEGWSGSKIKTTGNNKRNKHTNDQKQSVKT